MSSIPIRGASHYTDKSINEVLAKQGALLCEPFSGTIKDKHLIRFQNGNVFKVRLDKVLYGKAKGIKSATSPDPRTRVNKKPKRKPRERVARLSGNKGRWTEDEIKVQLQHIGVALMEPYKGSITKDHLVMLLSGDVKSVPLNKVLAGLSVGKMPGVHTTESINKSLSNVGAYLCGEYKGNCSKKHWIRYKCGHVNYASPHGVIRGKGCAVCNPGGFNPENIGYLYVVKVWHQTQYLYKVGITNKTVEDRYRLEKAEVTTVCLYKSERGRDAQEAETKILKAFAGRKYEGDSPFAITRTREIFIVDITQSPRFDRIIKSCGLVPA